MPELARWGFAVGVGLAAGVVGWFAMPLLYVPWLVLRHHPSVLAARLRAVTR